MYEILVYLFENYQHPTAFPENQALYRKLTAVGFDNHEIREALTWLARLQRTLSETSHLENISSNSFRIFDKDELKQFDTDCRNFLYFLESTNAIDAKSRELIIELSLALKEHHLTVDNLKVISLIALWSLDKMPDALMVNELLSDQLSELH